ncbi:MAG: sulfotransferase [Lysobacteraceae bacterium]
MQILVAGMHRTGTSVVSRLINMMGAYFGPEDIAIPAQASNPRGFWERRDVLELNSKLLQSQSAEWHSPLRFNSDLLLNSEISELKESARKIVHGLDGCRPWVLKDPRFALTLPFWRPLLESPIVVVTSRNPCEVALSLEVRDAIPFPVGVALWEYYTVKSAANSKGLRVVQVSYDEMIKDPCETTEKLFGSLTEGGGRGLSMPSKEDIRGFVDLNLKRQIFPSMELPSYLLPSQLDVWRCLQREGIEALGSRQPSAASMRSLESYEVALERSAKVGSRSRSPRVLPPVSVDKANTHRGNEVSTVPRADRSVGDAGAASDVARIAEIYHRHHLEVRALDKTRWELSEALDVSRRELHEANVAKSRLASDLLESERLRKLQEASIEEVSARERELKAAFEVERQKLTDELASGRKQVQMARNSSLRAKAKIDEQSAELAKLTRLLLAERKRLAEQERLSKATNQKELLNANGIVDRVLAIAVPALETNLVAARALQASLTYRIGRAVLSPGRIILRSKPDALTFLVRKSTSAQERLNRLQGELARRRRSLHGESKS